MIMTWWWLISWYSKFRVLVSDTREDTRQIIGTMGTHAQWYTLRYPMRHTRSKDFMCHVNCIALKCPGGDLPTHLLSSHGPKDLLGVSPSLPTQCYDNSNRCNGHRHTATIDEGNLTTLWRELEVVQYSDSDRCLNRVSMAPSLEPSLLNCLV